MKVKCSAIVVEQPRRDNLSQCIEILGAVPHIDGDTVWTECESTKAKKLIELFSHYIWHEISEIS